MRFKHGFRYARAESQEESLGEPQEPIYISLSEKRPSAPWRSKWLLIVLMVVLTLSLLVGASWIFFTRGNHIHRLPADSFFPSFPLTRRKFEETPAFMRLDAVGDQAWDGLIPNGAGYVKVPHPRRYEMEKSVPFGINDPEESEIYQASVIHQLHCLGTLRLVLAAYTKGQRLSNRYDNEFHISHCLNILRLGIMCASDTTLAFAPQTSHTDKAFNKAKFNGIGTVHTCRDWESTIEFLEEHRAFDWNGTIGHT